MLPASSPLHANVQTPVCVRFAKFAKLLLGKCENFVGDDLQGAFHLKKQAQTSKPYVETSTPTIEYYNGQIHDMFDGQEYKKGALPSPETSPCV